MKHLNLHITISDDYLVKEVSIVYNTTGLPSDMNLIHGVSWAMLKGANSELKAQNEISNLLSELNIKKSDDVNLNSFANGWIMVTKK